MYVYIQIYIYIYLHAYHIPSNLVRTWKAKESMSWLEPTWRIIAARWQLRRPRYWTKPPFEGCPSSCHCPYPGSKGRIFNHRWTRDKQIWYFKIFEGTNSKRASWSSWSVIWRLENSITKAIFPRFFSGNLSVEPYWTWKADMEGYQRSRWRPLLKCGQRLRELTRSRLDTIMKHFKTSWNSCVHHFAGATWLHFSESEVSCCQPVKTQNPRSKKCLHETKPSGWWGPSNQPKKHAMPNLLGVCICKYVHITPCTIMVAAPVERPRPFMFFRDRFKGSKHNSL